MTTEQLAIIGLYAFATVAVVIMLVVTLTVIKAILRIGGHDGGRISRFDSHKSRTPAKNH